MPAVLAAILLEDAMPLSRLNPSVPSGLEKLVHRMIAKDPALRPTASEVEEALAALAAGDSQSRRFRAVPRSPSAARSAARTSVGRSAGRTTAARDGRGRILTVMGEPGIGKTDPRGGLPGGARHNCRSARCWCAAAVRSGLPAPKRICPVLEALDSLLHQSSSELGALAHQDRRADLVRAGRACGVEPGRRWRACARTRRPCRRSG